MLTGLYIWTLSFILHRVSSVSYSCGLIPWMEHMPAPGVICDERYALSGLSSWLTTGWPFLKWKKLKLRTVAWKFFTASWNNIWLYFRSYWQVFAVPWNSVRLRWVEDWTTAVRTVHRVLSSHEWMPNILLCVQSDRTLRIEEQTTNLPNITNRH